MITSFRDFKLGKNLYEYGQKKLIYVRFKVKGVEVRRSTGFRDLPLAQKAAWAIYCDVAGIQNSNKVALRRSTYIELSELGKFYKDEIAKFARCSSKSAAGNFRNLSLMLSDVGLSNPRIDKIDADIVTIWRQKRYEANNLVFGSDEDLKLNYTLNSIFRQAKSVFSRAALNMYKNMGIKIPPSIVEFNNVAFLKQMDTRFIPIPSEIDEAIKLSTDIAIGLKSEDDIKVWQRKNDIGIDLMKIIPSTRIAVAVQLARFCGLTVKEIIGIRWEWFEKSDGVDLISIRYRPAKNDIPAWGSKGDKKNGEIPINSERLAAWRKALNTQDKKEGYVFDLSSDSMRSKLVERAASKWVAQFLPDREKKLHELRKQAGSEVATAEGIFAAAEFLRDSVQVAEKHYAKRLRRVTAL